MDIMEQIMWMAILAIGGGAGYFLARFSLGAQRAALQKRLEEFSKEKEDLEQKLEEERGVSNGLRIELSAAQTNLTNQISRMEEKKAEVEELNKQFEARFRDLANSILEEKTQKFTLQNKEQIGQILEPLGLRLEEFKKKVETVYSDEARERNVLKGEISKMYELNQQITKETQNLTRALKGDTKQQGNWGEVVLKRILEKSGLEKGREYYEQESSRTDEGSLLRPDVVVLLPEEKFLIIDSKVSLTAYERFVNSETEDEKQRQLKEHARSVRAHIKGLSDKKYQNIHGDQSPDFVLLFIPVESAFSAALQHDAELYSEAFEKNIVLVSPTTLLATMSTVQNLWKREKQSKNAQEIADRGGRLYDKFALFLESMEKIGTRIRQTQDTYDSAMKQLSTGSGNLLRQVETLRELGVQPNKRIKNELLPPEQE